MGFGTSTYRASSIPSAERWTFAASANSEDAIETLKHSLDRLPHLIRTPLKVGYTRLDPVVDQANKNSSAENAEKANEQKNPKTDWSAK